MKAIVVIPTILGVFWPHLWSLLIVLRALPLLRLGSLQLESMYLPAAFATFRLVENLPSNSVFAWSEFAFLLLVAFSLHLVLKWWTSSEQHYFLSGLFIGSSLLAFCALFNFFDSIYLVKPWMVYPTEVQKVSGSSFRALSTNAIMSRDLGFIGPGTLSISIRLRHLDPEGRRLEIPLSLVRGSGPSEPDMVCSVDTEWSICKASVSLATRQHTILWLGGWDRWSHSKASILEVSTLRIYYETPPPIAQILTNSGRIAGFTFNPNALGLVSLIGILLIVIHSKHAWPVTALTAMPFLTLLLLSGSRASLGGLILFIVILLIKPRPWARAVGYLAPALVILAVYLGFRLAPEGFSFLPRILNPFSELYEESRISLYSDVLSRVGFSITGVWDFHQLLAKISQEVGSGPLEHAHSLWLQVYGVTGLAGLVILLFLFFRVEFLLSRKKLRNVQAAFFALYFVSFFDYFAFYPPYYILLFGLSLLAWAPSRERVGS